MTSQRFYSFKISNTLLNNIIFLIYEKKNSFHMHFKVNKSKVIFLFTTLYKLLFSRIISCTNIITLPASLSDEFFITVGHKIWATTNERCYLF